MKWESGMKRVNEEKERKRWKEKERGRVIVD
jgi:hypothetical protein